MSRHTCELSDTFFQAWLDTEQRRRLTEAVGLEHHSDLMATQEAYRLSQNANSSRINALYQEILALQGISALPRPAEPEHNPFHVRVNLPRTSDHGLEGEIQGNDPSRTKPIRVRLTDGREVLFTRYELEFD